MSGQSQHRLPRKWLHPKTLPIAISIFALYIVVVTVGSFFTRSSTTNDNYRDAIAIYQHFLGQKSDQKTLLLFQNNAELRYGGGFIGSVGLLRAGKSGYKLDPIRSVYYYDHTIDDRPSLTPVPTELVDLVKTMHLRDSGTSLNWPDSAKLAAYYYEQESGEKVNNVVGITPDTLKSLLQITGPIALPDYGITVTPDNFLTTVQLEVEQGSDKQAKRDPKTILGVLGNQIIQKLLDKKITELTSLAPLIGDLIQRKQILLFSDDEAVENTLVSLGTAGQLSAFAGNYLLVGEANTGANKSSPFIDQTIQQHLIIHPDGSADVELTLMRQHTSDFQYNYTDPADGQSRWLVGENDDDVRVVVPQGSTLTSSSVPLEFMRYGDEAGRHYFGYRVITQPKQASTVTLQYHLPFRYATSGQLTVNSLFEMQNGGFPQQIEYTVSLPPGYQLVASSVPNNTIRWVGLNDIKINQNFDRNQLISLVFTPNQ